MDCVPRLCLDVTGGLCSTAVCGACLLLPFATAPGRQYDVHVIYYGTSALAAKELESLADAVFRDTGPKWNLISRSCNRRVTRGFRSFPCKIKLV